MTNLNIVCSGYGPVQISFFNFLHFITKLSDANHVQANRGTSSPDGYSFLAAKGELTLDCTVCIKKSILEVVG